MSVRRYGRGELDIVYLHGLGEAGGVFGALLSEPMLRNGYRHVVPDLPGYGRSPWPASPSGLDELADQLLSWLADCPQPPILVGHSMGGVLAVLIAEKSPGSVRAIVNIEGNVSLGDCTFSGRVVEWPVSDYVTSGHEELAAQVFSMGTDSEPQRFFYAALRFADPASMYRHARDLVDISAGETMAARMASLAAPCIVVAGVPDGLAARSIELLDAAGVVTVRVQPAGHWVNVDQPARCARVIADLS